MGCLVWFCEMFLQVVVHFCFSTYSTGVLCNTFMVPKLLAHLSVSEALFSFAMFAQQLDAQQRMCLIDQPDKVIVTAMQPSIVKT